MFAKNISGLLMHGVYYSYKNLCFGCCCFQSYGNAVFILFPGTFSRESDGKKIVINILQQIQNYQIKSPFNSNGIRFSITFGARIGLTTERRKKPFRRSSFGVQTWMFRWKLLKRYFFIYIIVSSIHKVL